MPSSIPVPSAVLDRLGADEALHLDLLRRACALPGVSADPAAAAALRASAELFAGAFREAGMATVRLLEIGDAPPYVYAEHRGPPGSPTLLVYGHYDVVPPGREELWESPPWALTSRSGRLHARGAADDKGGCVAAIAAISAWLGGAGSLPLTLRVLIEGEEEASSAHFPALLEAQGELLHADFALICDAGNIETGLPTLVTSTRGACGIGVELRSLRAPLHSGIWGGVAPDPAMALCALLGSLVDDEGRIAVSGFYRDAAPPGRLEDGRFVRLEEETLVAQAGLVEGASPWGEAGWGPRERLWSRPSLTVIALEGRLVKDATAAIMEGASARILLRTVPGMDSREAGELIVRHLKEGSPRGTVVEAKVRASVPWWSLDLDHPAVGLALQALERGFGRPAVLAGDGASIGILDPLVRHLGGAPCLLLGVEDPGSAIHAENEGLDLGEWRGLARSIAWLFAELAGAGDSHRGIGKWGQSPSRRC